MCWYWRVAWKIWLIPNYPHRCPHNVNHSFCWKRAQEIFFNMTNWTLDHDWEGRGGGLPKGWLIRAHIIRLNDTQCLSGLQSAMKTDYLNPGMDPVSRAWASQPCAPKLATYGAASPQQTLQTDKVGQPLIDSSLFLDDGCFKNYHQHLKFFWWVPASQGGVLRSSHFFPLSSV